MNGLEIEFEGALKCEILDVFEPENQNKIKAYGFGSHGMVIFDPKGNIKKKLDGHILDEPQIRAALKEVMKVG